MQRRRRGKDLYRKERRCLRKWERLGKGLYKARMTMGTPLYERDLLQELERQATEEITRAMDLEILQLLQNEVTIDG